MELTIDGMFKTRDLGEGSALVASGLNLIRVEPGTDGKILYFVFDNKKKSEQLSNKYWSHTLKVDAYTFSRSMRELKDRIFRLERR